MVNQVNQGYTAYSSQQDWVLNVPTVQKGDCIGLFVSSSTTESAAPTTPKNCRPLYGLDSASGTTLTTASYTYFVPETPPSTLTFSWPAASTGSISWVILRGVNWLFPTDDIDVSSLSVAADSEWIAPALTAADNSFVISTLMVPSGSATINYPSGYTNAVEATGRKGCIGVLGTVSAGAVPEADWTSPSFFRGQAGHIAFRDDPGAVLSIADSFTDSNGTVPSSHTSDSGSTIEELEAHIFGGEGTTVRPSIESNRLQGNGSSTTNTPIYRYTTDPGSDDYDIEVDLNFDAAAGNRNHVIYFGLSDTGTFWDEIDLWYVVAANTTSQAWFLGYSVQGTFSPTEEEFDDAFAGGSRHLKIEYRSGGNVTVYVDGVQRMQWLGGPITQRGRIGVGSSRGTISNYMDNLSVRSVGGGGGQETTADSLGMDVAFGSVVAGLGTSTDVDPYGVEVGFGTVQGGVNKTTSADPFTIQTMFGDSEAGLLAETTAGAFGVGLEIGAVTGSVARTAAVTNFALGLGLGTVSSSVAAVGAAQALAVSLDASASAAVLSAVTSAADLALGLKYDSTQTQGEAETYAAPFRIGLGMQSPNSFGSLTAEAGDFALDISYGNAQPEGSGSVTVEPFGIGVGLSDVDAAGVYVTDVGEFGIQTGLETPSGGASKTTSALPFVIGLDLEPVPFKSDMSSEATSFEVVIRYQTPETGGEKTTTALAFEVVLGMSDAQSLVPGPAEGEAWLVSLSEENWLIALGGEDDL